MWRWRAYELEDLAGVHYWNSRSGIAVAQRMVVYLGAADNVARPLPSSLSEVNQPVIRSRNLFSGPHPACLAYL
jgi:hypothetical protein